MRHVRLTILTALLCVLTGCHEDGTYTPEFLTDDTLRLAVGQEEVITYNPLTCQYAFNTDRLEFRLHTDNMSDYFIVRLQEEPTKEEQVITARCLAIHLEYWRTDPGITAQQCLCYIREHHFAKTVYTHR